MPNGLRTIFVGESADDEKITLYQNENYPLDEFHIRVDDGEVCAISEGSAMRVVADLEEGQKVTYIHLTSPEWSGVAKGYITVEDN